MIFPGKGEVILPPGGVYDIEPLGSAGVAIVVLIELHTVFFGFFGPPGRNHVERDAALTDVIYIRGLLGEQRGKMKRGTHGDHEFERFGDGCERGGGGPGVERWSVRSFDVVEVQFRDER